MLQHGADRPVRIPGDLRAVIAIPVPRAGVPYPYGLGGAPYTAPFWVLVLLSGACHQERGGSGMDLLRHVVRMAGQHCPQMAGLGACRNRSMSKTRLALQMLVTSTVRFMPVSLDFAAIGTGEQIPEGFAAR